MRCASVMVAALVILLAAGLLSCGGGGQSSSQIAAKNSQAIAVTGGPANNYANGLFTTVTVCAPGTSNCESIPNVLVDTGSFGLRLLAPSLGTLSDSLPKQTAGSKSVFECGQFVDSVVWGPVVSADVTLSNQTASSVPVQVIDASSVPIPAACKAIGPSEEDVTSLGANGILGVGFFIADCGNACTASSSANPGFYYSCAATSCSVISEAVNQQVQNPVALLPNNNNGIVIQLPAAANSSPTIGGSLILGIGTAKNNEPGSAQVFAPDQFGNLQTTFQGNQYAGFLDTGSNAYFFLDSKTTGIPNCSSTEKGFYCPASPVDLSATNSSSQGASSTVNFTIVSASQLFSSGGDAVFPTLGGPNPATFDWGLPFFFGRKVFVAIEGRQTPLGAGPFWAY
jgi:uncharacterized protein DUF3443